MKVCILAGGYGTRFSEETINVPKPMIQIGGKPILWHIMKLYSHYGFNDFVILGGYKCYVIKEFFANYLFHQSDVTIGLSENSIEFHSPIVEKWKVTILDTGLNTMTAARIKKAINFIGGSTFMLTYGDGLGDINISELLKFHYSHGKALTMTAVQPEGRFGAIDFDSASNRVNYFIEKPKGDNSWINGGFFVCEPKIFEYIDEDEMTIWEQTPIKTIAENGELFAYKHYGFWKPMDMLRDKVQLEKMWHDNKAPWKVW